jgi:predicted metal-dependent phosphoesterase TrpH
MAHPYYYPGLPVLHEQLPTLIEAGLAGLETYYGEYTPEQVKEVRELADAYGLLTTGGTDYHGPGIHPTPLGSRHVPAEVVERLRAAYAASRRTDPPIFELAFPI